MDDIENQLSQLFETAASRLEPPVEEIVTASTALGRRRRLRRATGTACAAAGVVGLTAGVVLGVQRLGIGGGAGGHEPVAAAAQGRTAHAATGTRPAGSARPPTDSGSGSGSGTGTGTPSGTTGPASVDTVRSTLTPTTAPALLTQLLSAYGLYPASQSANPIGVADAVYDDGHGQSEIILSVEPYTAQLASSHAFTCNGFIAADAGPRPSGAPAPACTEKTAANGRAEYLVVTATDGAGFYDFEVDLFTTDGLVVALDVGNGTPKGATVDVTRAVPPLTLAQMESLAADPGWLAYRDRTP